MLRKHDIHIKLNKKEFLALRAAARKDCLLPSSFARQLIVKGLKVRGEKIYV